MRARQRGLRSARIADRSWTAYGDVCSGDLWSARLVGTRLARPRRVGVRIRYLVSFGEDARGRIYALSLNGAVWRLRA